ncbi:DgyrCDS2628 [Dimorphilus gyrociliatus]|uniref:DgyrCDS2628 n=1 Tax=Dimorphilus gyrociliatus TaxID=2664684 RepID=A0A7I8VCN2_9ANNE|nr:DgyrCDS2628 [Dimorphilus gyrociliatus]
MVTKCFESKGYLKFILVFVIPFTIIFHFSALYAAEWHIEKSVEKSSVGTTGGTTRVISYGLFRKCQSSKCESILIVPGSIRFVQILMIFSIVLLFLGLFICFINFFLRLYPSHKILNIVVVMFGIASPLTLTAWIVYLCTVEAYEENAQIYMGNCHRLAITSSILSMLNTILISIGIKYQKKKISPANSESTSNSTVSLPTINRTVVRRGRRNYYRRRATVHQEIEIQNIPMQDSNNNIVSSNRNSRRTHHQATSDSSIDDTNGEVIIRAPPPYESRPPPYEVYEPPPPYQ